MIKYSKLNQGQIEATMNKLGGMEGMEDFLAGKSKVIALEDESGSMAQRMDVFSSQYLVVLAIRDFFRGWNNWQDNQIDAFGVSLGRLTHQTRNLAVMALKNHQSIETNLEDTLLEKIDALKERLIRFNTKENLNLELDGLGGLANVLKKKDYLAVLECVYTLRATYNALNLFINKLLVSVYS